MQASSVQQEVQNARREVKETRDSFHVRLREETTQLQASEKHLFELEKDRLQTETDCKMERMRTQIRARLAEERFKLETVENLADKELEIARDQIFRSAQQRFMKQK